MGSGVGSDTTMQAAGMRAAKKHSPQPQHSQQHYQQAQQGQGLSLPAVNGAAGGWGSSNPSSPGTLYQQQQQQHLGSGKLPAGGSKWGSQAGCTAAGLSGLGSSLQSGLVRNSYDDPNVHGMQCPPGSYGVAAGAGAIVSSRSSLASSLSNLDDALAGLHGGPAAGMLGSGMMPGSFGGYHVKGPSLVGAAPPGGAGAAGAGSMLMGAGGVGAYGGVAGRYSMAAGVNLGIGSNSGVVPGSLGATGGMLGAQYGYGQQLQQPQQQHPQHNYYH